VYFVLFPRYSKILLKIAGQVTLLEFHCSVWYPKTKKDYKVVKNGMGYKVVKKLKGTIMWLKCDNMFSHYDAIHECHGHTDEMD